MFVNTSIHCITRRAWPLGASTKQNSEFNRCNCESKFSKVLVSPAGDQCFLFTLMTNSSLDLFCAIVTADCVGPYLYPNQVPQDDTLAREGLLCLSAQSQEDDYIPGDRLLHKESWKGPQKDINRTMLPISLCSRRNRRRKLSETDSLRAWHSL